MSLLKRPGDDPRGPNKGAIPERTVLITERWQPQRTVNDINSMIISDIKTHKLCVSAPISITMKGKGKAVLQYATERDAENALRRFKKKGVWFGGLSIVAYFRNEKPPKPQPDKANPPSRSDLPKMPQILQMQPPSAPKADRWPRNQIDEYRPNERLLLNKNDAATLPSVSASCLLSPTIRVKLPSSDCYTGKLYSSEENFTGSNLKLSQDQIFPAPTLVHSDKFGKLSDVLNTGFQPEPGVYCQSKTIDHSWIASSLPPVADELRTHAPSLRLHTNGNPCQTVINDSWNGKSEVDQFFDSLGPPPALHEQSTWAASGGHKFHYGHNDRSTQNLRRHSPPTLLSYENSGRSSPFETADLDRVSHPNSHNLPLTHESHHPHTTTAALDGGSTPLAASTNDARMAKAERGARLRMAEREVALLREAREVDLVQRGRQLEREQTQLEIENELRLLQRRLFPSQPDSITVQNQSLGQAFGVMFQAGRAFGILEERAKAAPEERGEKFGSEEGEIKVASSC